MVHRTKQTWPWMLFALLGIVLAIPGNALGASTVSIAAPEIVATEITAKITFRGTAGLKAYLQSYVVPGAIGCSAIPDSFGDDITFEEVGPGAFSVTGEILIAEEGKYGICAYLVDGNRVDAVASATFTAAAGPSELAVSRAERPRSGQRVRVTVSGYNRGSDAGQPELRVYIVRDIRCRGERSDGAVQLFEKELEPGNFSIVVQPMIRAPGPNSICATLDGDTVIERSISFKAIDGLRPVVRPLASRGTTGRKVGLRFYVSDDSLRTRDTVTIFLGGLRVATLRGTLSKSEPGVQYKRNWQAPARPPSRVGQFCVQALDAAGNQSVRRCASLKLAPPGATRVTAAPRHDPSRYKSDGSG